MRYIQLIDQIEFSDKCWIWTGCTNGLGYGVKRIGPKIVRVHRLVYEMLHEPIPEGMMLRHNCDVRNCVRPSHMTPGTHEENMKDMVDRGRSPRGEASGLSKISDQDVVIIRKAWALGASQKDIACELGISQPAVSDIVNRKTWRHLL